MVAGASKMLSNRRKTVLTYSWKVTLEQFSKPQIMFEGFENCSNRLVVTNKTPALFGLYAALIDTFFPMAFDTIIHFHAVPGIPL